MDKYKQLKTDCIDLAKRSWLVNHRPPFVVGFKGDHNYPLVMPGFSVTPDIQSRFLEIVTECEEWDAVAVFSSDRSDGKLKYHIKLIMPNKVMIAEANIIDDHKGVNLSDFDEWQAVGNVVSWGNYLAHDVVRAM